MAPTLNEQIRCLRREVMRRADAIPFDVERGALGIADARWEQACMVEALRTLLELAATYDAP